MKYWRGYLTAAILLAITYAFRRLGIRFAELIDMVYPYVMRTMQTILAQWSSAVPFCLWQVALAFLVAVVLGTAVLMIIFKWNPIQWFGWVLAAGCLLILVNTVVYGLNAYAGPMAEDIRLETKEYNLSQVVEAVTYYRDQANGLAKQVRRDADGNPEAADVEALSAQAAEGFDYLVYERMFPVFAGSKAPVKELSWADRFTKNGVMGMTVGITGEAAVNPQSPTVIMPLAVCREMVRRMCIVNDGDATFGAFLACRFNSDVNFRYAAYFIAYRESLLALQGMEGSAARLKLQEITSGESKQLQRDLEVYNAFVAPLEEAEAELAEKRAERKVERFIEEKLKLKPEIAEEPMKAGDLMIYWYVQELIAPRHEEIVVEFDPFDESQVDLSGIVNARGEA